MIEVHGPIDEATLASIEALVSSQKTMEEVVRWGLAQSPPRIVARVVVQDEYCHDVVMPYRGDLYLVYDTT